LPHLLAASPHIERDELAGLLAGEQEPAAVVRMADQIG